MSAQRILIAASLCLSLGCTEDARPGPSELKDLSPRAPVVPLAVKPAPEPPPAGGFDGRVLRADGGAALANLRLVSTGTKAAIEFSTDQAGVFSQPGLAEGEYEVVMRAEGEFLTRLPVYLPQHGTSLRMSAGRDLIVEGAPAGADLRVWESTEDGGWESVLRTSETEGRATMRASPGTVYLEATQGKSCTGVMVESGSDGVIRLDRSDTMKGEAYTKQSDTKGSKRLPEMGKGWILRATPASATASPCLVRTAQIAENGSFVLAGLRLDQKHRLELINPRGASEVLLSHHALPSTLSIWWFPTRSLLWLGGTPRPQGTKR